MLWIVWINLGRRCSRLPTPRSGRRAGALSGIRIRSRIINLSHRESTHHGIKEVVKPFDWSYSTDYKGTVTPGAKPFEPSSTPLPIELLKRPDPILFFDEVMLYEDELADNGITMLSCKIRVMPSRLLLLARFFMRLDNVLFRLRDTRVYVDFETDEVIREYVAKEEAYEKVHQVSVDFISLIFEYELMLGSCWPLQEMI